MEDVGVFENALALLASLSSAAVVGRLSAAEREQLVGRLRETAALLERNALSVSPEIPSTDVPPCLSTPLEAKKHIFTCSGEPHLLDLSFFKQRHIALKIAYLGWNYDGFALQRDTKETVEEYLFAALRKAKLVGENAEAERWSEGMYSRCGRTDKGVSALGQVVCLLAQRAAPRGVDGRRFSCTWRHYKYFFELEEGMDGGKMRDAARALLGEHDFRNYCKMDAVKVHSYTRGLLQFSLSRVSGGVADAGRMHVADIRGTAFLYHQVRCMMAVLLM
eukprot:gene10295-12177_t